MKHQFSEPPAMDDEAEQLLDLHSLVNIFNVLIGQLQVLGLQLRDDEQYFKEAIEAGRSYLESIQNEDQRTSGLRDLDAFISRFMNRFEARLQMLPEASSDPQVAHARENLESCFSILQQRVAEYEERMEMGDRWMEFPIERLRQNLKEVFQAIEKNSGGRYHIVYNLARQESEDYFVDVTLESANQRTLRMPPVFQDTIRDLVANARKYTNPGGKVLVGLYDTGKSLRFVVEDNGRGIPEEELLRVVEYGYRASNVRDKPTMGGGFGLTKALSVVHRFGGTMDIESAEGRGTRIEIHIPRQGT